MELLEEVKELPCTLQYTWVHYRCSVVYKFWILLLITRLIVECIIWEKSTIDKNCTLAV